MNHGPATRVLSEMIEEERIQQAERRRLMARDNSRCHLSESKAMRMALGPGIQFGGATDGVLEAVTGCRFGPAGR